VRPGIASGRAVGLPPATACASAAAGERVPELVSVAEFSPDGQRFITAHYGASQAGFIRVTAFSPDSRALAAATDDGTGVRRFSLEVEFSAKVAPSSPAASRWAPAGHAGCGVSAARQGSRVAGAPRAICRRI
jgi:hypothetical protein